MGHLTGQQRIAESHRCAFTLVEVIFVVVIIGVIATMAAPRFGSAIAQQQIGAAVRRVETDLNLVQYQAKVSSSAKTIQFDVANDRYTITGMLDPDHPGQAYVVKLSQSPYEAQIVLADFTGVPNLTFDGYGFPQKEGSVVIKVGNSYRTITVTTGGVRTVTVGNIPLLIAPEESS